MILGPLKVERVNKSYDEVQIWKFYEHQWLLFYPVGSLSILADEPELRYIYYFSQLFDKA